MQSEHKCLNYVQSQHESELAPYLNCNQLSTPLQSKHESKLTYDTPKPKCNRDRENLNLTMNC